MIETGPRVDPIAVAAPASAAAMRASVLAALAGKAAEMVTLLLLATVVPRMLGPDVYGRFSVPLTIVTLGSLALTLGGPTLMARYVPTAPPAERPALARALGWRLARGRTAQIGGLAVVGAVLAVAQPATFPPLVTALVLLALALNVAATLALQVGLGLGRTGGWSARYPVQNSVLIVGVLVARGSAEGLGGVLVIVLAAIVGAGFAAIVTAPLLRPPEPNVTVPDGAMRFGILQATGAALVQLTHRGGVLATAVLAGSATETGYAALATGIALGVTYAVLQAFTVSLPHLAGDDAAGDGEAALRRLATGLLAVLVPAVVVVAALLDALVPRVFGTGYLGAVDAFAPALALVVLAPVNALAVQIAALRLRPDVAAIAGAASATTFLLVAVLIVPAWGAAGATTAALAGTAASALVAARWLPGAVGATVGLASVVGAGAVLAVASLL